MLIEPIFTLVICLFMKVSAIVIFMRKYCEIVRWRGNMVMKGIQTKSKRVVLLNMSLM